MNKSINVTFPEKEYPLYDRIMVTKPKFLGEAEHVRNLCRETLDGRRSRKRKNIDRDTKRKSK